MSSNLPPGYCDETHSWRGFAAGNAGTPPFPTSKAQPMAPEDTENPLAVVAEVLTDWFDEVGPENNYTEEQAAILFGLLGTAGYSIVPNVARSAAPATMRKQPEPPAKPRTLPTKEALAKALSKRYGGKPVTPEDILDLMPMLKIDLHFQATRGGRTDWYEVVINSAGQPDHTSIQQLPF